MKERRTGFFFDEKCLWHFGKPFALFFPVGGWVQPPNAAGFCESPDSKRRLKSLMDVSGLTSVLDVRSAPMLAREDLARVHPATYLDRFAELSAKDGGDMGFESTFGPGGYDIARVSAGLAAEAVEAVLKGELRNAYALSRPPGHHCLPDKGLGFCLLANGALAIERAIARHKLSRVAVIDWDVHHGNGTEAIFYERPDVLTISLHQDRCFPLDTGSARDRGRGRGEGYNINVPLLAGGGHQSYVDAMELIVLPALARYRPELIIVACGYDASIVDPLARMMAHSQTYRYLMQATLDAAADLCNGRVVAMHEGGYSEAYVPFCGQALMEALSGHRTDVVDPNLEAAIQQQPGEAFIQLQRRLLEEQAQEL
ncbi:MAG: class II histone deacetylase [Aestuariivirga sp.]|uniref:class II histone deacetylase n=1 Tax=Aestuariivirga sp. TaxID=2650926 RepID=UPI0025C3CDAD|nr:class II histone deacetylase [Aestuariivirga sp.]MCA3559802.1 class II histone deacetylase [Aestuariivirga sp.]